MKTRKGFVSNSSSTSFVVAIPDKFNITAADVDKLDDCYGEVEVKGSDKVAKMLNKAISTICKGNVLMQDDGEDNYWLFPLLEQVLEQFVIAETDSAGGDGCGTIQQANMKKLKELMK
jgi:hypothetical protein